MGFCTPCGQSLQNLDQIRADFEKLRSKQALHCFFRGRYSFLSCFLSLNRTLKKFNKIGKRPQFPSIRPRRFLRRPNYGDGSGQLSNGEFEPLFLSKKYE